MVELMNKREVLKLEEGTWKEIPFLDLKDGDTFKLNEPNGDKVTDSKGNDSWIAKGDAFRNKDGIGEIDVYR